MGQGDENRRSRHTRAKFPLSLRNSGLRHSSGQSYVDRASSAPCFSARCPARGSSNRKAITTKDTKDHQGKPDRIQYSPSFASFVVKNWPCDSTRRPACVGPNRTALTTKVTKDHQGKLDHFKYLPSFVPFVSFVVKTRLCDSARRLARVGPNRTAITTKVTKDHQGKPGEMEVLRFSVFSASSVVNARLASQDIQHRSRNSRRRQPYRDLYNDWPSFVSFASFVVKDLFFAAPRGARA